MARSPKPTCSWTSSRYRGHRAPEARLNRATGRNPFEDLRSSGRMKFCASRGERRPGSPDRWHIILAASGMCDAVASASISAASGAATPRFCCRGIRPGTLGRIFGGADRVRSRATTSRSRPGYDPWTPTPPRRCDRFVQPGQTADRRRPFLAHGEPDGGAVTRLVAEGFADDGIITPSLDGAHELTAPARAPRRPRPDSRRARLLTGTTGAPSS
jgi:hypothetical protein